MTLMNIHHKQSQFELFPGSASPAMARTAGPRLLASNITLSVENMVVSGICIFMAMILFFSMGVERGKRIVFKNTDTFHKFSKTTVQPPAALSTSNTAQALPRSPAALNQKTKKIQSTQPAVIKSPVPAMPARQASVVPPPQKVIIDNLAASAQNNFSVSEGAYTIQVASFKKEEYANQEASSLRKKGYQIFVISKGNYSIVCVGKFSQERQAQLTLGHLKRKYKDSLIRRL